VLSHRASAMFRRFRHEGVDLDWVGVVLEGEYSVTLFRCYVDPPTLESPARLSRCSLDVRSFRRLVSTLILVVGNLAVTVAGMLEWRATRHARMFRFGVSRNPLGASDGVPPGRWCLAASCP